VADKALVVFIACHLGLLTPSIVSESQRCKQFSVRVQKEDIYIHPDLEFWM